MIKQNYTMKNTLIKKKEKKYNKKNTKINEKKRWQYYTPKSFKIKTK